MATFNKFQDFVEALGLGEHNLNTDTLKVYLSNITPSASDDADKENLDEIAAGNGYTAGGTDIINAWAESGGTGTLTGTNVTWTASAGTIGPFRYVVLYNDTHSTDGLIGWWDYGSSITLNDGEQFTVDFGATILTIA